MNNDKVKDEKDIKLTEKNLNDIIRTFKDPIIFDTLVKYHDELVQSRNEEIKITKDDETLIKNLESELELKSNIKDKDSVGGVIKWVKAYQGLCFKTHSNMNDVVYVCVSHYPTVGSVSLTQHDGWIIPYSLFPLESLQCSYTSPFYKVYHIIFGSDTFNESTKNKPLNKLLIQTSIQAIYQTYKELLDIIAIKYSKKQFTKEFQIKQIQDPFVDILKEPELKEIVNEDESITPIYKIINIGINGEPLENPVILPKRIHIEIQLPRIEDFNVDDLGLEIDSDEIIINQTLNPKYKVSIKLQHQIDEDNDSQKAYFIKSKKILKIEVPIKELSNHDHSHTHTHNEHTHTHTHTHNHNKNISNTININNIKNEYKRINESISYFYKYLSNTSPSTLVIYSTQSIKKESLEFNNELNFKFSSISNSILQFQIKLGDFQCTEIKLINILDHSIVFQMA